MSIDIVYSTKLYINYKCNVHVHVQLFARVIIMNCINLTLQILKARNSILHSASCTLTKEQLDSYIADMVTLLEDKKILLADVRAQTAVLKLKEVKLFYRF